jgi:hypothetical protein
MWVTRYLEPNVIKSRATMRHAGAAALAAVVLTAACTSEPPPPLIVPFARICEQDPRTRVVVDGYLRLPMLGITCKSGRCVIAFYAGPGGKGPWIGADVRNSARANSGVNAIEMPEKTYRIEDLRVHLKDGRIVDQDAKVRLTGHVTKSGSSCRMEVDIIETP